MTWVSHKTTPSATGNRSTNHEVIKQTYNNHERLKPPTMHVGGSFLLLPLVLGLLLAASLDPSQKVFDYVVF